MGQRVTKTSSKRLSQSANRHVARFRRRGASLGLGADSVSDLMQQIERGFSFDTLLRLEANSGVSLALLASVIGIPERTLARRRAAGTLQQDESERLLRSPPCLRSAWNYSKAM